MEAVPIQSENFKLGFIGAGKMAESIARGVVQSGVLPPQRISTAIHSNPSRVIQRKSNRRVHLRPLNGGSKWPLPGTSGPPQGEVKPSPGRPTIRLWKQVVDASDVIIFSVKPQVVLELAIPFLQVGDTILAAVKNVILQLRPLLSKKKLLVSIAAGVKLKDLEEWAGHDRFIRVMPNTPSAVGMGASVMSLGGAATEQDGELVGKLFGAVGKTWKADEKLFDAVTGLSGSGPAYIYLAIEALADGGVAAGLPRELALGLASQTVLGAAAMAVQSGKHPGQLKDDVTSPGGTTIAGIHELEKNGFRGTLMNAVVAAAKRSQELSKN
ncbi:hypothetical protein GOBAR_DD29685 [Gossypium barbadense]|nr:hypothetical protein GOBAR_DD29685 [Gossypium barbadense]